MTTDQELERILIGHKHGLSIPCAPHLVDERVVLTLAEAKIALIQWADTRAKAQQDASDGLCGTSVSWWGGEYDGTCELPKGHQGPHYDGISCFTDEGDAVELKERPLSPVWASVGYYKQGKLYHVRSVVLNPGNNHVVELQPESGVTIRVEVKS